MPKSALRRARAWIAGIAAVGTAYNAIRGAAARPDPYFILNVMGVQLAEAKRTKIDNLD